MSCDSALYLEARKVAKDYSEWYPKQMYTDGDRYRYSEEQIDAKNHILTAKQHQGHVAVLNHMVKAEKWDEIQLYIDEYGARNRKALLEKLSQ